jgi:hypothetical protein
VIATAIRQPDADRLVVDRFKIFLIVGRFPAKKVASPFAGVRIRPTL